MFKKVYFWIIAAFLMIAVVYAQQQLSSLIIVPNADNEYVFMIQESGHGKVVLRVDTDNDLVAIKDDLDVDDAADVGGDLTVGGDIAVTGDLTVTGADIGTGGALLTLTSTVIELAGTITSGTGFWDDCPSQASNDISSAFFYVEDFIGVAYDTTYGAVNSDASFEGWLTVADDGAAITSTAGTLGGIIQITPNSGSNQEVYMQLGELNTETFVEFTASSGKEVWLEYRVASDDITGSAAAWFVGLADEAANAADFMDDGGADFGDDDFVGFYQAEANEDTIEFIYQTTGSAFV